MLNTINNIIIIAITTAIGVLVSLLLLLVEVDIPRGLVMT
jgi:hypothetical protein